MVPGLRALLTGLIDYAGLFPPAALGMRKAVENYAAYREDDLAWMLSRFICPAGRLGEFAEAVDKLSRPPNAWALSTLAGDGKSRETFLTRLASDLKAVHRFNREHEGRVLVDACEVRLPHPLLDAGAPSFLEALARAVSGHGLDAVYVEIERSETSWQDDLRGVAQILAGFDRDPSYPRFGLKIRTGGLTPDAFPTPEQVSTFVLVAKEAGVPFKATAGLHHPVRHVSSEVAAPMHGFFNVFAGAVLAATGDMTTATLTSIIEEEDPRAFSFGESGLGWRNRTATTDDIGAARTGFCLSVGSCSFTEPIEDLKRLGLR